MQTRSSSLQNMLRSLLGPTLFALSLIGAQAADAATRYVPTQYPNIQAAVDAAAVGDTVLVANGTYTVTGNHDIDFKGKDLTVKSSGGANVCILDCQGAGRGFYLHTGETIASRIDGFTIKSGYNSDIGGGVCIGSNGTVANCILSGNIASQLIFNPCFGESSDGTGGGMSGGTAIDCTFNDNSSTFGGGMTNGIAINGTFNGNSAPSVGGVLPTSSGGGMFKGTAINCLFSHNSSKYGGAMDQSTATNCLFVQNGAGGGSAMTGGTATNCTFTGNVATGALWDLGSVIEGTKATNCILWKNVSPAPISTASNTITYSDVEGGNAGVGNINVDPGFVNAAAGDYRLLATSRCIDSGTTSVSLPATDLDSNTRLVGKAPDMGAYEYHPLLPPNLYVRNDTSGQERFWKFDGTTLLGSGPLLSITDPNWKMVTAADLFRQGNTDLIWRNDATGDVVYWDVKDGTVVSSGYIWTVADPNG